MQNVVTYDVVIAVDNPDLALKPGMTATVSITTGARDDALRVPLRALPSFRRATRDRAARRRRTSGASRPTASSSASPVRTGVRDDAHVAITDGGLQAGDVVVLALDKAVGPREGPRIPGVPRFR